MPSPRRQSSTVSTMMIPPMSMAAPAALVTTALRKSDTEVTSPSTRWISSPGVWVRWNSWSRPSTWRVIVSRRSLVVRHAATVASQTTMTARICVTTAIIRNSRAKRVISAVVVALGCQVDDLADDEWPRDEQRRADRDEHAEAGPTPGVGSKQRTERAPSGTARRGLRGHRTIVAPVAPSAAGITRFARSFRTRPRQTDRECLRAQVV